MRSPADRRMSISRSGGLSVSAAAESSRSSVVSPIAGFIFDARNVQTELSNLQTEIIASIYPIKVGMVSYEDNIDQAIANLKAAGLDTYLNEYRTQFSAYLEANPWVLEMAK